VSVRSQESRRGIPAHLRKVWEQTYRETPYRDLPWFSPRPYYWVVRAVHEGWFSRGTRVLDIGCGAGTHSIFLARAGFHVSGVDLAPGAIDAARRRAARKGLAIDFRVADALRLPYRSGRFGGAVDVGCFHTIPVKLRPGYARELYRVLRAHGVYVVSWIGPEHSGGYGPPFRPSLGEVAATFESRFIFRTVEYRPQTKGGFAHYTARLERRSSPLSPARSVRPVRPVRTVGR
jgi:SAM-dependent methyltransferase